MLKHHVAERSISKSYTHSQTLTHTLTHTLTNTLTHSHTPLNKSKPLITTQHTIDDTHSVFSTAFEPAIPAFERPYIYPSDRKTIEIGSEAHKLLTIGLLTAINSFKDFPSTS